MRRQGRLGPWYVLGISIIKPPTLAFTRREATGAENVPRGGVILAAAVLDVTRTRLLRGGS